VVAAFFTAARPILNPQSDSPAGIDGATVRRAGFGPLRKSRSAPPPKRCVDFNTGRGKLTADYADATDGLWFQKGGQTDDREIREIREALL